MRLCSPESTGSPGAKTCGHSGPRALPDQAEGPSPPAGWPARNVLCVHCHRDRRAGRAGRAFSPPPGLCALLRSCPPGFSSYPALLLPVPGKAVGTPPRSPGHGPTASGQVNQAAGTGLLGPRDRHGWRAVWASEGGGRTRPPASLGALSLVGKLRHAHVERGPARRAGFGQDLSREGCRPALQVYQAARLSQEGARGGGGPGPFPGYRPASSTKGQGPRVLCWSTPGGRVPASRAVPKTSENVAAGPEHPGPARVPGRTGPRSEPKHWGGAAPGSRTSAGAALLLGRRARWAALPGAGPKRQGCSRRPEPPHPQVGALTGKRGEGASGGHPVFWSPETKGIRPRRKNLCAVKETFRSHAEVVHRQGVGTVHQRNSKIHGKDFCFLGALMLSVSTVFPFFSCLWNYNSLGSSLKLHICL